jgi:sulfur carrier protein ThiS
MAKILFLNNAGAGFADNMEIPDGTTVEKLFRDKLPGEEPGNYLIRVNRLPSSRDQILKDGDRVSITATKIDGARFQ